ncbi:MAG TPA: 50S ribosomal protein L22 [Firmicutes bacterium]|nr:50S ribosomal protein L22 [Bacillota bacterium]
MEAKVAKAHLKQLRMTPRKVKIVLDLIRNKNVAEAAAILKTTNKLACESVEKLLKSAVANAETNHGMDVEKLYVAECFVTPGKLKGMKRVMPRARGSAFRIVKRTSHVTVVLKERD